MAYVRNEMCLSIFYDVGLSMNRCFHLSFWRSRMITRRSLRPIGSALLGATLCLSTAIFAQDTSTTNTAKKAAKTLTGHGGEDQYPDLVEIDPFGGVSIYGQVNRGLTTKIANGGVGGIRIAYNPTLHFGIELWGDYANAPVRFISSAGNFPAGLGTGPIPPYSFGAHNYIFGLNPGFNLTPPGSK